MMICIGIIRKDIKTIAYIENGRVVLATEIRSGYRQPKNTTGSRRGDNYDGQ